MKYANDKTLFFQGQGQVSMSGKKPSFYLMKISLLATPTRVLSKSPYAAPCT